MPLNQIDGSWYGLLVAEGVQAVVEAEIWRWYAHCVAATGSLRPDLAQQPEKLDWFK